MILDPALNGVRRVGHLLRVEPRLDLTRNEAEFVPGPPHLPGQGSAQRGHCQTLRQSRHQGKQVTLVRTQAVQQHQQRVGSIGVGALGVSGQVPADGGGVKLPHAFIVASSGKAVDIAALTCGGTKDWSNGDQQRISTGIEL